MACAEGAEKFFPRHQKKFPKPRFSAALELRGEGGRGSRGGGEGVQGGGVPPPRRNENQSKSLGEVRGVRQTEGRQEDCAWLWGRPSCTVWDPRLIGGYALCGWGGGGWHWKGGRYPTPLQGAQPTPSPCPPDAKCPPQWHL